MRNYFQNFINTFRNILTKKFYIKQGPAIGELLEEVRDLQLTGEMSTKQQAMDYVDRKLKKQYSLFDI
jgi:hypothetical protein